MSDCGKEFPVVTISRENLTQIGMTAEHIALLTDEDLEQIALHMADMYILGDRFANDLRFAAWNRLIGKTSSDEAVPKATTEPIKAFPITHLSRYRLKERLGLSDEYLAEISDSDMQALVEHMAALYQHSLFGKHLRLAFFARFGEPTVDWEAIFPVLAVKRSDLKEGGVSEEEIKGLTDDDLEQIAAKLAEGYHRSEFLGIVAFLTKIYLAEGMWKQEDEQAQSE